MYNSPTVEEAGVYRRKSEYLDPSKGFHLEGEEKILESVSLEAKMEVESPEVTEFPVLRTETRGFENIGKIFEKETPSDDVDIKHEPLEPDVEHYVSIPAGLIETMYAEVV